MLTFLVLFAQSSAWGVKFTNQFVEFELPPQWACQLEGAEWVCQNTLEAKKKDAIIVLAAKIKGPQDSMDQYLMYLKGAKQFTSTQGKPVKSNPKYAKTSTVNGQGWIDALHLESELPGFFTRYFATVKDDLAILVTASIKREKYQEYLTVFDAMFRTLKAFRKPGNLNTQNLSPAMLTSPNQAALPVLTESTPIDTAVQGGSDNGTGDTQDDSLFYLLLFGGLLIGAFLVWKRRQQS